MSSRGLSLAKSTVHITAPALLTPPMLIHFLPSCFTQENCSFFLTLTERIRKHTYLKISVKCGVFLLKVGESVFLFHSQGGNFYLGCDVLFTGKGLVPSHDRNDDKILHHGKLTLPRYSHLLGDVIWWRPLVAAVATGFAWFPFSPTPPNRPILHNEFNITFSQSRKFTNQIPCRLFTVSKGKSNNTLTQLLILKTRKP